MEEPVSDNFTDIAYTLNKDSSPATPETTPSRRSSRKKQSTFSSDFEYYTPIGRKNQPKEEEKKEEKKTPQVEDQSNDEVKNEKVETIKKPRGRPKATAMKKTDNSKEAKTKSDDEDEKPLIAIKGVKRKKLLPKSKSKKVKNEEVESDEDSSGDDEDSTPISQLKAQMDKNNDEGTTLPQPLVQNLVKKFLSTSPLISKMATSPVGQKRKAEDATATGATPPKKVQPAKKVEMSQSPVGDKAKVSNAQPGLIKKSTSASATKTSASKSTERDTTAEEKQKQLNEGDSSSVGQSSVNEKVDAKTENVALVGESKIVTVKSKSSKTIKKEEAKPVVKTVPMKKGTNQSKTETAVKPSLGTQVVKKLSNLKSQLVKEGLVKDGDGKVKLIKAQQSAVIVKKPQEGAKIVMCSQKKVLVPKMEESTSKSKPTVKLSGDSSKDKLAAQPKLKPDSAGTKHPHLSITKKPQKPDLGPSVDDLLKRGVIHKKKSHQPFGNKKPFPKPINKDPKTEAGKDKQEGFKKKTATPEKKTQGEEDRRKSVDAPKVPRNRTSSDSAKGERRKSVEGKKLESATKQRKSLSMEDDDKKKLNDPDGPPPLIPANAQSRQKVKHHKPEHEAPVDMTMMDLFKPDGLIVHDQQKKEEVSNDTKPPAPEASVATPQSRSQYPHEIASSETYVKPENIHHVLMEHQYSKPTSPILSKFGEMTSCDGESLRDDDIESVSHKHSVIIDVNLPEQILEESDKPLVRENSEDENESIPIVSEPLPQVAAKRDSVFRSSILESLDYELRESGNEFIIVGQVEVDRSVPLSIPDTSSSPAASVHQTSNVLKSSVSKESSQNKKDSEQISETKKFSEDSSKSSSSKTVKKESSEKPKAKKRKLEQAGSEKGKDKDEEESEEEEEDGFEDDENDQDWEPNDPDTLYCICRKPHNNRQACLNL
ncbi:serine-rich adhesin for platelets [Biomphalaria pfeifferi]|uniref:Serine-rich adhesin for platelets n=1 Tax=Biomphalaria pfeifferi TaxID=112525 RepID=A0AAD8C4K7_BIOPF|nr:serine-rich adhesin for platelets [Biomphalaria pfeifferi]